MTTRRPFSPYRLRLRLGRWPVGQYIWFILKNAVGWVLILASFVVGPLFPGPTGIPLFLIGFALIWFPGKRRLTARVLRGKPIGFDRRRWLTTSVAIGLAIPLPLLLVRRAFGWSTDFSGDRFAMYYAVAAIVGFALLIQLPWLINLLLRVISKARRKVRPWLRRRGIDLLPPRRRARYAHAGATAFDEQADAILALRLRRRSST